MEPWVQDVILLIVLHYMPHELVGNYFMEVS